MGAATIGVQAWAIHVGDPRWQTMAFNVLCLSQMGHVLAIRSESRSLFSIGLFSNKPLLGAVLLTFALQMAVTYVSFLQPIFNTEALTLMELVIVIVVSSVVFIAVELEKLFFRVRRKHGSFSSRL
jgi:Ca2+-transporting ATPase